MLSSLPSQALSRLTRTRRHLRNISEPPPLPQPDSPPSAPRKAVETLRPDEEDLLGDLSLAELNGQLQALSSVFPDVRVEVFREMLSTFSDESRLELVTEALIRQKSKFVKGRWRVPPPDEAVTTYKYRPAPTNTPDGSELPPSERFRSEEYKSAVTKSFFQEFKGLDHSTIKGVLAEYNYSYSDSRPTLIALYSKSWRFSISKLWMRKKAPSILNHPLIVWQQSKNGNSEPVLKTTESKELNQELFETLIAPFLNQRTEAQFERDEALAKELNEAEAEEVGATYDCQCCFSSYSFEQIATCDSEGHYLCFPCLQKSMNEALYGQNWSQSISMEYCTLRCIALSGSGERCKGNIPREILRRTLDSADTGTASWAKFEDRAARENIAKTEVRLDKCPFCAYASMDESAELPDLYTSPRNWPLLFLIVASLCLQSLLSKWPLLNLIAPLLAMTIIAGVLGGRQFLVRLRTLLRSHTLSFAPAAQLSHGRKFICRNPDCLRVSCLTCSAPWRDIHICHESERAALRTYVESAMADAVKRTCPRCNLSFIKASGCNKLTCVCGYSMCYVCRSEISEKEGYSHFCHHFRPDPGQRCTSCERCDLYRVEDEDGIVQEAKERAEREWWEREARVSKTETQTQTLNGVAAPNGNAPNGTTTPNGTHHTHSASHNGYLSLPHKHILHRVNSH